MGVVSYSYGEMRVWKGISGSCKCESYWARLYWLVLGAMKVVVEMNLGDNLNATFHCF